jgi:hypothetical protein
MKQLYLGRIFAARILPLRASVFTGFAAWLCGNVVLAPGRFPDKKVPKAVLMDIIRQIARPIAFSFAPLRLFSKAVFVRRCSK